MEPSNYLSPFSWRYSSNEMREIWSEVQKRRVWRRIWTVIAEVQSEFGLITPDQVADLRNHMNDIDISRSLEIENEIRHDVMAEVRAFAEQCPEGGGVIHLGMTSMDIVDNADVLRVCDSLDLVLNKLRQLLRLSAETITRWADLPVMGFTHLQPAEPSTLGYRFAQYGQDLLGDWENLKRIRKGILGKGFTGAVGTSASYADLIGRDNLTEFQNRVAKRLNLTFFPVTTQTYTRKQDYEVSCALAGLGATLYKFAFDLRVLQSPPREVSESFGEKQVGSSAMPFKRNPIGAEKINSLARLLAQYPRVAWDNAAHSLLERTLDDSANRRTVLPEGFLIADELLGVTTRIISDLQINREAISQNLKLYAPFAGTERVLIALSKEGADRQEMHERLRKYAIEAWEVVQRGAPNPLQQLITSDTTFLKFLPESALLSLLDVTHYLGDAPERARRLATFILDEVSHSPIGE